MFHAAVPVPSRLEHSIGCCGTKAIVLKLDAEDRYQDHQESFVISLQKAAI